MDRQEGKIRILNVSPLHDYLRLVCKHYFVVTGKITCICWDATGNFIVTGSVDTVRVWNVKTGQAVHRMTTGRSQNKKETIVWSLAVTNDFTIITGDSR